MPVTHQTSRAIALLLLSGFLLASLDATAKVLVPNYPIWWIAWARYAGHTLVVLPFVWRATGGRFWHTEYPALQMVRSTLMLLTTLAFFFSLRYLPLAETSAIAYMTPMFTAVLSGPFLGEVVTRSRRVAAGTGFFGVLLITRPGSAAFHPAALVMIGMALCNSVYQMLTRKLSGESPLTSLFYSSIVGTVVLTLWLPFEASHPLPGLRDAALFVLLGVLGGVGHGLLIMAFARGEASLLAPFAYLHMIWPLGYGWLLFDQFPDAIAMIGVAVIIMAGAGLGWQERRRRAAATASRLPPRTTAPPR